MLGFILSLVLSYQDLTSYQRLREPEPILVGTASWYDYSLPFNGGDNWSKTHSTCALRIYERYQTFKVCSEVTGKCIECYHNDYGPARTDRVIDLSSKAFKELGVPLSRGLTPVKVFTT